MKILIACEESQVVAKAFRNKDHEAFSCDIIETSGDNPEWHIKGDVTPLLKQTWDMIIAFPPCTYLCSSGMHWTTRGLRDPQLTVDAINFVKSIWNADCDRVIVENPVGCLSREIRKPDQIIQPWEFGHDASKQTCLWLKGVKKLKHTDIIPPKDFYNVVFSDDLPLCKCCEEPWCDIHNMHYSDCECVGPTQDGYTYIKHKGYLFAAKDDNTPVKKIWANQTPSGQNKLGPGPERTRLRSKTYEGIANAMALQWG